MAMSQEVIKVFMRSLDQTTLTGISAVDEAIRACSNFDGLEDLISRFIDDRRKSLNGNTFLRNYCGIILDNADTGAITGYDAGGSSIVKTTESIVPESGLETAIYPPSTSFSY